MAHHAEAIGCGMFWWRETRPAAPGWQVDLAFTDTEGGVSVGSCAGLNLGAHVGDEPEAVAANRAAVAEQFAVPVDQLAFMRQVHGAEVVTVDDPSATPTADGIVTARAGMPLVVLVADCTPVLLYATDRPMIAAVHAGRPGMVAEVVPAAVSSMRAAGANAVRAVVGPSVCARCYEVPDEMRSVAAQRNPSAYGVSWTGTAAIDVAAGVVDQLHRSQVPVTWLPGCTRESDRLFSYRRDHQAGRFAGIVMLQEAGDD